MLARLRTRRSFAGLLAGVALSVAAVGCGGSDEATTTPGPDTPTEKAEARMNTHIEVVNSKGQARLTEEFGSRARGYVNGFEAGGVSYNSLGAEYPDEAEAYVLAANTGLDRDAGIAFQILRDAGARPTDLYLVSFRAKVTTAEPGGETTKSVEDVVVYELTRAQADAIDWSDADAVDWGRYRAYADPLWAKSG